MNAGNLTERLALMRRDSPLAPGLIDTFGEWVRCAADEELFRVDVLSWANRRGVSEDQALDLFLHAATAGIFELSWGAICPSCGMMIQTPGGLRALGPNPHCKLCRADFAAAMDDQLEVTFSVEPGIRMLRFYRPDGVNAWQDADKIFFGSTREPVIPEVSLRNMMRAAKGNVPGSEVECEVSLDVGNVAMLVPQVHAVAFLRIEPGGASEMSFELHDGAILPAEVSLAPGPVRLRMANRTHHFLTTCVVQLPSQQDMEAFRGPRYVIHPFLSGKRVLTSQTFRDLFRTETIGDKGLSIKSLAILFTDLQASTALYERVGDLRALELVRAHFDKLMEVVRKKRGAIVKTIGDAVMAAFAEPESAVAAAAEMTAAVRTIDTAGDSLAIKIGIHAGSCVAIQTNHQIDYFGSAVNTAARVQGVARGGEIVVTEPIWHAPGVRERTDNCGLRMAPDTVRLRGIAAPVSIFRLN
jgi:class 3 adenylate cyclase